MTIQFTPAAGQAPAANADAVCTLAAPTDGSRWSISQIMWSYSAAPSGGQIIIAWASSQMVLYAPSAGPGLLDFSVSPLRFPTNAAVSITLKAGGSGISGTIYPIAATGN